MRRPTELVAMSQYKVASRKNLYDSEASSSDEEVYLPKVEFDIVEVDVEGPQQEEQNGDIQEEPEAEEFAFPLFGSATAEVMTVSMKEEEEEVIVNERPESYYRAKYSSEEQLKFQQAAISAEDIFAELKLPAIDGWPWKVMSLKKHNENVEKEKLRGRRRRPGMKKRVNAIQCRERKQKREKAAKKLLREEQARFKKQKYRKFKPKTEKVVKQPSKPKYRTE